MSAARVPEQLASAQIVAIGELLIDFVPLQEEGAAYIAKAGGAPANVAVIAAALGASSLLISRVGEDWLGEQARSALTASGARTDGVLAVAGLPTGVAVVAPADAAGPAFLMYRQGSAENELRLEEHEIDVMRRAAIIHLSSLLPTSAAGRAVAAQAVEVARSAGAAISYDVNLRPSAWRDETDMVARAHELIEVADIVKITEHELERLGIGLSPESARSKIWLVTDGARGARLVTSRLEVSEPAPVVDVVDTTGAGDATLAYLLYRLAEDGLRSAAAVTPAEAADVLRGAVGLGSWVVQHAGATDWLPSAKGVLRS